MMLMKSGLTKDFKERMILLWGTGNMARKVISDHPDLKIDAFVDNNTQAESPLIGKKVLSPNELSNLENPFFIVSTVHYKDIFAQLDEMGYDADTDYIDYLSIAKNIYFYDTDVERNLSLLCDKKYAGKTFLFFYLCAYDAVEKGLSNIFSKMNDRLNNDLIFFQERPDCCDKENKPLLDIETWILPEILHRGCYIKKNDIIPENGKLYKGSEFEEPDYIKIWMKCNKIAQNFATNLSMKFPDMSATYSSYLVYSAWHFFEKLFSMQKPQRVILWNEFYAIHGIIREVCQGLNIDVCYIEFGNLPGTIQFDGRGQMGESLLASVDEKIERFNVSTEEIEEAKILCKYLKLSKANRKKQPSENAWKQIESFVDIRKPIILFMGQNDYESGIQPYTNNSKTFHSPIFKSSDEAALYLQDICTRNNWNFVYKPHPIIERSLNQNANEFTNVCMLRKADINDSCDIADVVVTILSTAAYVALVREKPVLMLGYTQLKSKGCTYEAFSKNLIEKKIKQAIAYGYDTKQRDNFYKHVAQLNKYYLYRNEVDQPNNITYGKNFNEFSEDSFL